MYLEKQFNLFRWLTFIAVTFTCIYVIIRYLSPPVLPIIILNAAVPPFLFFFFSKNTINRLGVFLLCSPVVFIFETLYIIIRELHLPVHTALNLLACIFTLNLTLFALFGEHFTGRLKQYMDFYLAPLLLLNLTAYFLIYSRQSFNMVPYIVLLFALAGFYLIMVRQIRAHERMIAEQRQTIINTRIMIRNIIHDLANYISTANCWSDLAFLANDSEKRDRNRRKVESAFKHANDHIKTVSSILCDYKNIVSLSRISPSAFYDELLHCLKDSFVGEVLAVKGQAGNIRNDTLTFAIPPVFSGKWLYVDTTQFNNVILNLISNAKKAGATGMALQLEETEAPHGLHFTFRDNGRGIPHHKVNLLFKERVDSDNGLGIGLLGVRMIVNCHNATIVLENANSDGKGCTEFCIRGLLYCS